MPASNPVSERQDRVAPRPVKHARASANGRASFAALVSCLALVACATKPLVPYTTDTPPLILVPASYAGVQDKRARFREIYCAVLEAHGRGAS